MEYGQYQPQYAPIKKRPGKVVCFLLAMLAPIIYLTMQSVVQIILLVPMAVVMGFSVATESMDMEVLLESAVIDLTVTTLLPSMVIAACATALIFYFLFKGIKNFPISRGVEPKMFLATVPSVAATIVSAVGLNVALTFVVELLSKMLDISSFIDKIIPGLGEYFKQITEQSAQMTNDAMNAVPPVMVFLAIGIVGPIIEELAFRQISFRALSSSFSIKTAIVLQAVFFGVAHGAPVQVLYTFAVGLIMGVAYYRTRSLFIPILFHVVFNTTACVMGYIVSDVMTMSFAITAAVSAVVAIAATVYLCAFSKAHKKQADF